MVINNLLSTREVIFNILLPFEKGQKRAIHVEELLDKEYEVLRFSPEDKRFGTFLAYGVLRHWFELSYLIGEYSNIYVKRLSPEVRLLLRIGMFQLYAMASVPDYAAISSTMNLADDLKFSRKTKGFINAILNKFVRDKKPLPTGIENMLPDWWLERLKKQFNQAYLESIARSFQEIPMLSIRVNTLKISVETYCHELNEHNIPYEQSEEVDEIIFVLSPQGNPVLLPGYDKGWFVVQNESSARVAHFLNPIPGETILEIGAAPGMKTSYLAALMHNKGKIVAVDISSKRMKTLVENCNRLGIDIVEPVVAEDTKPIEPNLQADKILIDAPCSGSGTIGKHPEILLTLKEQDFIHLAKVQLNLLENHLQYLKPKGVMVYSTCSIDKSENDDVVDKFLKQHPDKVKLDQVIRILPDKKRDGFYMARLINTASSE